MKKVKKNGLFVVFEGVDGCGKTTLAKRFYEYLLNKKVSVELTREPGQSVIGKDIKAILFERAKLKKRNFYVDYCLFTADRIMHIEEVILPALIEKKIILCDRFFDSSLVYQGMQCQEKVLKAFFYAVNNGISPHVTVYVKVSLPVVIEREKKRDDPRNLGMIEMKNIKELIKRYDALYKNKKSLIVIDGDADELTMFNQLIEKLTDRYLLPFFPKPKQISE